MVQLVCVVHADALVQRARSDRPAPLVPQVQLALMVGRVLQDPVEDKVPAVNLDHEAKLDPLDLMESMEKWVLRVIQAMTVQQANQDRKDHKVPVDKWANLEKRGHRASQDCLELQVIRDLEEHR